MRILLASSELHPYSKTGGLADMVAALAKYLAKIGNQVAVVTPLYRGIRERFPELQRFEWVFGFPLGDEFVRGTVWTARPAPNLTIYFVDQPRFFDRPGIYQAPDGDYSDNAERFIFFSKCVVNLARYLPAPPEIVHLHDWQAGLVPLMIRHQQEREGWGNAPRHCLTIHNLAYQGVFPVSAYKLCNLPWDHFTPSRAEFYGGLNFLKTGICTADRVTTVSKTYATEITTPEFGCGLDQVLLERPEPVVGILNGVDYEEWNTEQNPHLAATYSLERLASKELNKRALQHRFGLDEEPASPLFVNVSRLVEQKGADLQLACLEEYLVQGIQFALLGKGDPVLETAFLALQKRFPKQVAVTVGYDHALAHQIEAAGDFFVMPSRFEPCGLNQMYSLRYGTIPIVRSTGGLEDSVTDARDDASTADGIKFTDPSPEALSCAFRKALAIYDRPEVLEFYRTNAMRADFSWDTVATNYCGLYKELLASKPKPQSIATGATGNLGE